MAKETSSTISFDVLLRGETDDVSVAAENLDRLRPPAEAIERCFRWLSKQGVTCHRTDFGVACEAPVDVFEALFRVHVIRKRTSATAPPSYQVQAQPQPPPEIESLVSQVTVAQPPTLFN